MKLLYAVYIVMILSQQYFSVRGEVSDVHLFHMTDTVYTCSSYLSTLITKFCDNIFKIVKRDTNSVLIDRLTPRSLHELRDKKRKLALEQWRRVRRQIASECCDQPCSVGNLIKYCPVESKLLREHPDIFD